MTFVQKVLLNIPLNDTEILSNAAYFLMNWVIFLHLILNQEVQTRNQLTSVQPFRHNINLRVNW